MSRFTIAPRTAVLLAVVVVAVAVVVIVVGAMRPSGSGGGVVVAGASAAPDGGASAPDGPASVPDGRSAGRSTGPSSGSAATPSGSVVVHVVGAVRRSGIVTLPTGSRVAAAIEAAGGAADDADLGQLNLARVVQDGERILVVRVGEQAADVAGEAGAGDAAGDSGAGAGDIAGIGDVVDLNTADTTALQTLPGIGPGLAERILTWREQHGRFASVEDLLEVSGIGEKRFAELQDRVRV